ncbi:protein giant-like protein [Leptotrombidium deliense]|uniref:Protein giant-like protein n=1 Tax=Leptotrombidium deliense TaxID=299467 RepID=A0A443SKR2_9ACAR|nr:protein giant-like protein [Leptotrombidium deliense]
MNIPMGYYYGNNMPLQLAVPLSPEAIATQSLIATQSDQQYLQFREQMLTQKRSQETRRKTHVLNPSAIQSMNNSQGSLNPKSPNGSESYEMVASVNGLETGQSSSRLSDDSSQISNGGTSSGGEGDGRSTTPVNGTQSTRKRGKPLPNEMKDDAYWERRRKNNEAAKRSRDARRAKEDEIAIRAAFLEQENMKLRVEVATHKSEIAKLRCMIYNS